MIFVQALAGDRLGLAGQLQRLLRAVQIGHRDRQVADGLGDLGVLRSQLLAAELQGLAMELLRALGAAEVALDHGHAGQRARVLEVLVAQDFFL